MSSSEVKMYRQKESKITVSFMHTLVICNHIPLPLSLRGWNLNHIQLVKEKSLKIEYNSRWNMNNELL